jgi:acetyl-CoA carboxylase carboxyl transferase subunit beta
LPAGFQRSEFLLEHCFLDFIIDRKNLKYKLALVTDWFMKQPKAV